jgi:hypothetical protein
LAVGPLSTTTREGPADNPMAESSKKGAKKRITDDEWAVHRTTIGRLYLDEGKDVREVRDIMKREFGFEAQ